MDDQAAQQEEIQRLRQELHDIEGELARVRAERRLFGRSSFSPEWLILRQRALQTERDRCQSRLRELVRTGQGRLWQGGAARRRPSVLKAAVYVFSGLVVILIVAAFYLVVGQQPGSAPVAGFAPTPTPTATAIPSPTPTPTPAPTIYVVAAGDTLARIAQRYGISDWKVIAEANNIQDPRALRVGQELIIPPTPTPTSTPTAAPTPAPTPSPRPNP